jgi:Flp pilus assembly protein TadD
VQTTLGHKALMDGKLNEALERLQNSQRLNPAQPAVYTDLSTIADQRGDAAEALAMARKAAILDPFSAPVRKTLVLRLINAKQYEEAQTAMEKYLEDFPQDDFMRKMLEIAKEP